MWEVLVPQEKVTKSGRKFSGRRRWRIVRCCLSELQTHGFSPDPIPWIEEQVAKGKIQLFSGSKILDEIDELFGSGSPQLYYDMLKTSCDAFPKSAGKSFFTSYYYPQDEERKRNGVPVRKK